MILDVNLLNGGKANRLVPKFESLSAEVTFSSFISLASTFFLISNFAKFRCLIPLVICLLNLDASFLLSYVESQMHIHMLDYLLR